MALLDEPNIFAGPITRLQKVFNNLRTARENTYVAAMNEHEIRSIFEIASVESQSHRRCRIVQVMPEILSKPSRVVISALSIGGFLPPEADVLLFLWAVRQGLCRQRMLGIFCGTVRVQA